MISEQTIPCPSCTKPIPFDLASLFRGMKFTCVSCQSAVGLAPESVPVAMNAAKQLDQLRQSSPKNRKKLT